MDAFILTHESEIYLVSYCGAIALVAIWEGVQPRREPTQPLRARWTSNIAIALIDLGILKFALWTTALALSVLAARNGFGLLNLVPLPGWLAILLGVLAIDLWRWFQHVLLHRIPILWRVHRIHHSDHDFDFTVGVRFHPFDAIFTAVCLFPVILLLGPPPVAVVIADVLVATFGIFIHANGRTADWIERYGRGLFVTPDMHRIHHSALRAEHDTNYGGVFSFWDRLFRTYTETPVAGQTSMTIGLPELRGPECLKLGWMLLSPFRPMPRSEPDVPAPDRVTSAQSR